MLGLFALALLTTGSGTVTRERKKAVMSKHTGSSPSSPVAALGNHPTSVRALAGGAVVLAGLRVALAGVSWTGPHDVPASASQPAATAAVRR